MHTRLIYTAENLLANAEILFDANRYSNENYEKHSWIRVSNNKYHEVIGS